MELPDAINSAFTLMPTAQASGSTCEYVVFKVKKSWRNGDST
jgi:hypothetical protein